MAYPISDVPRRIVYSGSAGVGPYAFTFEVLAATDIAVYKNGTLLTLTTDYTVSINTGTGTGTITLVVAATGSDQITLVGDRAIERTSDFVTGGDLFANTLNTELDSLTIFAQQVDEKADRAIKAPVTDPTTINMTLPAQATRASKALGFNSSGNPTQSSSTLAAIDAAVTTIQTIAAASPGSSAGISHIAAGSGAVATTVQAKLREMVSVKDFGAVGDGVVSDASAVELAINAALASGRAVYFPSGQYNIDAAKSFIYAGELRLFGHGATLLLSAGSPTAIGFSAAAGAATTLAADVTDGDRSIIVSSATGIQQGQLIRLSTSTPVDSGWGYTKQAVFLVSNIVGTTLYLSEPSNFSFTIAETTVNTYQPASLMLDGVNVKQNGSSRRFDMFNLQNCRLSNFVIEGYDAFLGDVFSIAGCHNIHGYDLQIIKGRYPIEVNSGSRNIYFDNIFARDCRHPIDCTTWAFNIQIRRQNSINCTSAIQSHPSFEVHFEDCNDFVESVTGGGIGLRCIGGSVKRCRVRRLVGTASVGDQFPALLSAYQYLGQKYDRVYEDIDADTVILSTGDTRTLYIRNCAVSSISVDGVSSRIGAISVDTKTTVSARMTLKRIKVLSPDGEVFIDNPSETFASIDTIKNISGITKANPAVVTAIAHGFSNGDLVRIDGVTGMTQVNEQVFTIANVATDTFELSGVDSSSYTTYVSGGKAALGRLAKTIDPTLTPGLGWYPSFRARALLRKTSDTLNPLTAITIPVKVRNFYNTSEEPFRHTTITLRAVSRTDGCVVNTYQASLSSESVSSSSLSSAQAVVPALSSVTAVISNFRHHYSTQVTNEGGTSGDDAAIGEFYYSFDVVVTCDNTNDRINYVEVEFDEVRMN